MKSIYLDSTIHKTFKTLQDKELERVTGYSVKEEQHLVFQTSIPLYQIWKLVERTEEIKVDVYSPIASFRYVEPALETDYCKSQLGMVALLLKPENNDWVKLGISTDLFENTDFIDFQTLDNQVYMRVRSPKNDQYNQVFSDLDSRFLMQHRLNVCIYQYKKNKISSTDVYYFVSK